MIEKDTFQKFGYTFQIKIISALLSDISFLKRVQDILDPNYFESESNKWIIQTVFEYQTRYKSLPNLETFKAKLIEQKSESLTTSVVENLKDVYKHINSEDSEFIKETVLDFCKNKCIKNAILDSVSLLELGDYDEIKKIVDNAMKAGTDTDIGLDYTDDIESRYVESARKTIKTPWPVITSLSDGGLGAGELGVFVAPAGIGKSWALVNVGAQAIKDGLNVIHYTLELNQSYVGLRYDSVITGIPAQNLRDNMEEVKEKLRAVRGNLFIKNYPTKTASVNTIKSHIDKSIAVGNAPDMIILDYADLLKTGKFNDKRHELESIYEDLRALAGEYQIPIWTASQANRSSLEGDVEYIDASKIAESYSKVMIADFILSLSRKNEHKASGTGIWHVIKNRFGPDGLTFPSNMNSSNGQIYIYDKNTKNGQDAMKKMQGAQETDISILSRKYSEFNT